MALLSAWFGLLALLLSAIGLYGLIAYAVSRRRIEIGIRLALGASPVRVVRSVLGRVAVLVAIGVTLGAAASVWASRLVATLLYGIEPGDPSTLMASAAVLISVGIFVGWLPAYRASRREPAEVLRQN
jgi:ABC-type antimicrobial peptide transport system permease subunit